MRAAIPERLLRYAIVAAAAWFVGAYIFVALSRMSYPFDLEWMEGAAVDQVVRVLGHQRLYVAPEIAFIPMEYPPLYFYLCAAVAKIVGVGYFSLRLVSFLSSLACFAFIYAAVTRETRDSIAGVMAAGLFAATFRISGAWFDLARIDSLFLALFLAGVLVLRWRDSRQSGLIAGVLFALSFLTKQTALAMAVPLAAYVLYVRPRQGVSLLLTLIGVAGAVTALAHVVTNGWYTFYVLEFPFRQPWAWPVLLTFWTRDLLAALPIACAIAVLTLARYSRARDDRLFWIAVAAGMMAGAYRSRLQTGGYDNVLLPAYAIIAILCGLAATMASRIAAGAVYAGCLVQLALLVYNPRPQIPAPRNTAAARQLVQAISDTRGEVLLPYHGYLPLMAGKPTHAHLMGVFDVVKMHDANSTRLADQFRVAISHAAFDAIILDDNVNYLFMPEIDRSYVLKGRLFPDDRELLPVTGGVISTPQYVYVPRTPAPR